MPRTADIPGGGIIGGDRDGAPVQPIDVSTIPEPVPRVEPLAKYGNPPSYTVYGKRYVTVKSSAGYVERGIASWYGTKFHGRRTSSGEPYDLYAFTAAHKTLPLPTYVQVTNLRNGRTIVVRVNDRGPFHENRLIDLSYAAASRLGILPTGTGLVEVRSIDPRDNPPATLLADTGAAQPPPAAPSNVSVQVQAVQNAHEPSLYLQVGAFASRENAERLRQRLAVNFASVTKIVQATLNQAAVYRVRLGPLKDVDEADRIAASIMRLGLEAPHVVID